MLQLQNIIWTDVQNGLNTLNVFKFHICPLSKKMENYIIFIFSIKISLNVKLALYMMLHTIFEQPIDRFPFFKTSLPTIYCNCITVSEMAHEWHFSNMNKLQFPHLSDKIFMSFPISGTQFPHLPDFATCKITDK